MTREQRVLEHIKSSPGATTKEIATALHGNNNNNDNQKNISVAVLGLMSKGLVTREEAGHTISNVKYYRYFPTKTQGNVSKTQGNVSKPKRIAPKPKTPDTDWLGGMIDTLAAGIARHIAAQVQHKLKDEMNAMLPHTQEPQAAEGFIQQLLAAPPPRVVKPKVVIAGLLPQQAGLIQTEFGDELELTFWKDDSLHKLKTMVVAADYVVAFTGKLGHDADTIIKSSGTPFKRCVGGMTALRSALTQLYVDGTL